MVILTIRKKHGNGVCQFELVNFFNMYMIIVGAPVLAQNGGVWTYPSEAPPAARRRLGCRWSGSTPDWLGDALAGYLNGD
jgi:hypothetical protein